MVKKIKKLIANLHFRFYVGKRFTSKKFTFLTLFTGLSFGFMILIVVIGVMNGFQNNHISRRIEIGSYHAVITKKSNKLFTFEELKSFKKKIYTSSKNIIAVIPFTDKEILALFHRKAMKDKLPLKLRIFDYEEIVKDKGFNNFFKITYGEMDLTENKILIGEELGYKLIPITVLGGTVELTPDISIRSIGKTKGVPFEISGYFKTGSYDYDRYWAYISTNNLARLGKINGVENIGIKFDNLKKLDKKIKDLKRLLGDDYIIKSTQQINKGYFAALKLEKVMIIFLFAIIFILIAVNIFGALKLTILERKENILILKAIGLKPVDLEVIFLTESLLLAVGGGLTGLLLGIFVAFNIGNIFQATEIVINSFSSIISYFTSFVIPEFSIDKVIIYNTDIYYQTEFLVKLYFEELFLMFIAIVGITILAAYFPTLKASRLKPNKLMKDVL